MVYGLTLTNATFSRLKNLLQLTNKLKSMTIELNNVVYEVAVSRRRYGKQTFTWVDCFISPDGVRIGPKNDIPIDPFPCIVPKKSELVQLLTEWMENGWKWINKNCERIFI